MTGSVSPSLFGPATEGAPRVFLSYSWDSDEHQAWVKDLTTSLRQDGIEIVSDQFYLHPGMEKRDEEVQPISAMTTIQRVRHEHDQADQPYRCS